MDFALSLANWFFSSLVGDSTSDNDASVDSPVDDRPMTVDFEVTGIVNTGNTCFRNVILQSLASCLEFLEYLQQLEEAEIPAGLLQFLRSINRPSRKRSIALYLPRALEFSNKDADNSNTGMSMRTRLSASSYAIGGYQQDAQEYFQRLLSSLALAVDSVNSSKSVDGGLAGIPTMRESSGRIIKRQQVSTSSTSIRNPLTGVLASVVECLECGYASQLNNEPFTCLPVVPGDAWPSVHECISQFQKADTIEGYFCRRCSLVETLKSSVMDSQDLERVKHALRANIGDPLTGISLVKPTRSLAKKRSYILRYPRVLCLHFKRSTFDIGTGRPSKNYCQVVPDDPLIFDSDSNSDNPLTNRIKRNLALIESHVDCPVDVAKAEKRYRLTAVITHHGSHEGGHFVAYRLLNDKWFRLSDVHVSESSLRNVRELGKEIYMTFYQALNDT